MENSFIPKLSESIYFEQINTEDSESVFFVLDPDKPSWVFINGDGKKILSLCDGKNNIEDISRVIIGKNYSTGIVSLFLEQMKKNKILYDGVITQPTPNTFRGIALEITKKCNLRCKHCYLAAGKKGKSELSLEEIKFLLDSVKDVGGISVAIGGGEPLTRDDCLEIIEYAVSLGLLVSLGTNGTLIDKKMAKRLSKFPIKIQISLDGAIKSTHEQVRGKDSYEKTLEGIDNLIDEGMAKDLVIAFTPMKINLLEVAEIIEFAVNKQIPVVQFPPLSPSGRAQSRWADLVLSTEEKLWFWNLISQKSKELQGDIDLIADCFSMNIHKIGTPYKCTIGSQFRIDPDGKVYPCQCFHFGEEYSLGNIKEISLKEMVLGQKIKKIKQQNITRAISIEACKECKWRNFCGSGCMGNAYERTGTILNTTSCDLRKRWIENLFEVKFSEVANSRKVELV